MEISCHKTFGREVIVQDSLVEISPQRLFGRTSLFIIFRFLWVDFFLKRLLVGISQVEILLIDLLANVLWERMSLQRFLGRNLQIRIQVVQ